MKIPSQTANKKTLLTVLHGVSPTDGWRRDPSRAGDGEPVLGAVPERVPVRLGVATGADRRRRVSHGASDHERLEVQANPEENTVRGLGEGIKI